MSVAFDKVLSSLNITEMHCCTAKRCIVVLTLLQQGTVRPKSKLSSKHEENMGRFIDFPVLVLFFVLVLLTAGHCFRNI